VPQHGLNCTYRDAAGFPVAGARLAEAVQVMMLADGIGRARHFDLPSAVMTSSGPRRGAPSCNQGGLGEAEGAGSGVAAAIPIRAGPGRNVPAFMWYAVHVRQLTGESPVPT
jgi:hypothetical protein